MVDKSILAIIPARSGSKGLKNKNIKDLNGKPMISYTIKAAIDSGIFSDIIVSTDSYKYKIIAEKYGAWVPFLRPMELAKDDTSTKDTVIHILDMLEKKGKHYDYIMILQPTSPLRSGSHIREAAELLEEKKASAIVSISESHVYPEYMNTLSADLSLDGFISENVNTRRQDLNKYFKINGAIYLSEVNNYRYSNNLYKSGCYGYVMDKKSSYDIDDELDFVIVENLMKTYC